MSEAKRGLWGAIWSGIRVLGRVTLTLGVAAGAVFAVQFGASELSRRADAAPVPEPAALIPVSTSPLELTDGYAVTRTFVGQVEPQRTASLSFELPGRLTELGVDEGDDIVAGQVLARQDLALLLAERTRLEASRTATEAQLRFVTQSVERNRALNQRGFASQVGLDETLSRQDELVARITEIDAGIADVQIRIEKSQIVAPFDGRITDRRFDGGETVGAGQTVFGLVALAKPQVRVGVPTEMEAARLADATITLAGEAYVAKLVALRPDIDPVTRTRTAVFEIDTSRQPAFGQTAALEVVDRIPARGVWLPITTLQEGVRGQWTVLTVDPDSIVRAAPVEILHSESDRVFARGAFPSGTQLINKGPQRVTVGQQVALLASSS